VRLVERRGALRYLAAVHIARRVLAVQDARLTAPIPGRADHRAELVGRLRPELTREALQESLDAPGVEARDREARQLRSLEVEPKAVALLALRGAARDVGVDPPLEEHADRQTGTPSYLSSNSGGMATPTTPPGP
jgi:hypothetical protein